MNTEDKKELQPGLGKPSLLVERPVFDPELLYPGRSIRIWGYDEDGEWTDILGMVKEVQGAQLYVVTFGLNRTTRETQITAYSLQFYDVELYGPDRYEPKVPFNSEREDESYGESSGTA